MRSAFQKLAARKRRQAGSSTRYRRRAAGDLLLEPKAKGRKPSPAQGDFAKLARLVGAYYEVADTIDRALDVLTRFRLLR